MNFTSGTDTSTLESNPNESIASTDGVDSIGTLASETAGMLVIQARGLEFTGNSAITSLKVDPTQTSEAETGIRSTGLDDPTPPSSSLKVMGRWNGQIIASRKRHREFDARLTDLFDQSEEEVATFSTEDVPPREREWIVEGARFYWTVGYRIWSDGRRERASAIRIRRPTPVPAEVEQGIDQWVDALLDVLPPSEA
jgi:hypothetical protein